MSNMRRLARDHGALLSSPPPDYFLPPTHSLDNLTHLSIYLTGPSSTPYEPGVYHLTLKIPATYPAEPPKANFVTKIFHPNVCDRTGDVCVDTLKRDWSPKLTLTDVLVTIRCLLVFPNATSALNEAAGRLLLEDYEGFARHARLMAEVHAMCPSELQQLAEETRKRNVEEDETPTPAPAPSSSPAGIAEAGKAPGNRAQLPSNTTTSSTSTSSGPGVSSSVSSAATPTTPTHHRRIKKPVSSFSRSRPAITTEPTIPGVTGDSGSDSEGNESGKENVIGRVPSPAGSKRSRADSDLDDDDDDDEEDNSALTQQPPAPQQQQQQRKTSPRKDLTRATAVSRTGGHAPVAVGRKSPKLRRGASAVVGRAKISTPLSPPKFSLSTATSTSAISAATTAKVSATAVATAAAVQRKEQQPSLLSAAAKRTKALAGSKVRVGLKRF